MRRIAILAEGRFDWQSAKTAVGVIRYGADPVVAVIDSSKAGRDAGQALGDPDGPGRGIPIVADVMAALAYQPDTLLIGIAPIGGRLPEAWRPEILRAIAAGLNIVSGLHHFLGDDPEFAAAAQRYRVSIWDVRRPPEALATRIRQGLPHRAGSRTVYLCGSDCDAGKMTVAVELDREAQRRGLSSAFAATGQTGIMVSGRGIPVDRFISDFVAGGVEAMVLEFTDQYDWVFVEGQGALAHPAYSAVTLGIIHGAAPDMQVLCHVAGRTHIHGYDMPIPPLRRVREMYEAAAGWLKAAPVVAVALNTFGMAEDAARAAIAGTARETGLPTTDPVRFGAGLLLDALLAHEEAWR
jgi:uncharacterized NAD-dependent epimerase/dehydratase family protein